MSGALAAAQSVGCCCRPAPNVGCSRQVLDPWICGQDERWNELSVTMSGSLVETQQALPTGDGGAECDCYGGTQVGTASLPSLFLSKTVTPGFGGIPCVYAWILRNEIVVGAHSATVSDCFTQITCCYLNDPWPCNGFCASERFVYQRGPYTGIGTQFAPVCGTASDTVPVCGTCPNGPYGYSRTTALPASGPVILTSASLRIESGFTVEPCGIPTSGTPVKWVLEVTASPYYTCDGERIAGGSGGYSLRYERPCCDYLQGPAGVYTLFGADTVNGTYSDRVGCLARQWTRQFGLTATVTEV